ncbi:HAUS augmin-like complex subunit 6, partial [Bienertia sinuspersici]
IGIGPTIHPYNNKLKSFREVWEAEEIRVLILISLTIQALLTILAPYRKRCSHGCFKLFIWLLYLLADVVAMYTIGLISNNKGHHFVQTMELLALWASFLLLHLGALFYASRDNFRDSTMTKPEPGPNYARLMEEYYSAKTANIPADFKGKDDVLQNNDTNFEHNQNDGPPSDREGPQLADREDEDGSMHGDHERPDAFKDPKEIMVRDAYKYYQMYRPLLAEGFLSLKERKSSRNFFLSKPDKFDAFRIIEIELNLIYDAFYTKSFLLQTTRAYLRALCFISVILSLVLFSLNWDLRTQKTDVIITLILFCGAITLDICAGFMFVLSDWWLIIISTKKGTWVSKIMKILPCLRIAKKTDSKRWSNCISKYNLMKYCSRKLPKLLRSKWIYDFKYVRDFLIKLDYVKTEAINKDLLEFVITEIWKKAEQASDIKDAKEVFSARGNLALEPDYELASTCLTPWTTDVDYDESLMIWHLATDICYWSSDNDEKSKSRELSKALSDYMLYLVIWQQSLLSSVVGMSETRFQDTCAEAQKFMNNEKISIGIIKKVKKWFHCTTSGHRDSSIETLKSNWYKKFSERVLGVKAVVEPMVAKGDKSKSVLFDACRLAKQLKMFGDDQWEITSKVWLELLCYAAVRCSPRYHIAQLSKGGELITLVWLFMAHLGLGERFLKNQGFGLTKLVIQD